MTTVIGVIIILAVFFLDSLQLVKGPLFFNIAMVIVSFLMCHEFYAALEAKGYKPIKILGYLCTLFLLPIGVVKTHTLALICASIIPLVLFVGMCVSLFSKLTVNMVDVAVTLLGNVYTVFLVAFLSATRVLPLGVFLIFYIICGAWFSDIFAYLIGRLIGKHKFSTISPKKSIEGCIAGVFGTILFFIIYSLVLNNMDINRFEKQSTDMSSIVQIEEVKELEQEIEKEEKENTLVDQILFSSNPQEDYEMQEKLKNSFYTNIPLLIVLGIIVSIVAQIGDFAASSIKRYCEIKDFSNLMPGHGGMLDRFDSVLFVAPIVYFVFYIILKLF